MSTPCPPNKNTDKRIAWGFEGERLAAEYLTHRGYSVLAQNWRVPRERLQIDLVVASGHRRAFIVEVKHHRWSGSGFESLISPRQRARLLYFAKHLHARRYAGRHWGFMLVWVNNTSSKILEQTEF